MTSAFDARSGARSPWGGGSLAMEYESDGAWLPLPDWARYCWALGAEIQRARTEARVVAAISVPTRGYVSALIASGFLASRHRAGTPATLRVGDDVVVALPEKDGRNHVGKILRQDDLTFGQSGYWIEFKKGELRKWYRAGVVERLPRSSLKYTEDRFRPVSANALASRFLNEILEGGADDFVGRSRLECIVFGRKGALMAEMTDLRLRTYTRSPGTLHELVRPRGLVPTARTWIAGSGSARLPDDTRKLDLAIFEGATLLEKYGHQYRGAHWVIVVDRSQRDAAECVRLIRREHEERLDTTGVAPVAPPTGMQVMSFDTRRLC